MGKSTNFNALRSGVVKIKNKNTVRKAILSLLPVHSLPAGCSRKQVLFAQAPYEHYLLLLLCSQASICRDLHLLRAPYCVKLLRAVWRLCVILCYGVSPRPLPRRIAFCRFAQFRAISRRFVSSCVRSRRFVSIRIYSGLFGSFHAVSYRFVPFRVIFCAVSCCFASFRVVSCRFVPRRVVSASSYRRLGVHLARASRGRPQPPDYRSPPWCASGQRSTPVSRQDAGKGDRAIRSLV